MTGLVRNNIVYQQAAYQLCRRQQVWVARTFGNLPAESELNLKINKNWEELTNNIDKIINKF